MSAGSTRVLVVGDANLDLVLTGDVVPRFGQEEQLLESSRLVLGSSAGIVAHGLARLGVETTLVACVGDDDFGRVTTQRLREGHVDTSGVRIVDGAATGLSVILSAPHDRSILTDTGAMTSVRGADVRAALDAARAAGRPFGHLHVASWFLLPGLAAELPALFAEARADGVTISLDTNWDPAGRWQGLREALPHVDLFLPNREELRAVGAVLGAPTGDERDGGEGPAVQDDHDHDLAAAATIAALGPAVVVKAGRDGGWSLRDGGRPVPHPGLVLDVVDTTGAGDSFDAGYLAAWTTGVDDEAERLRWATTAGSLSTRAAGGTGAQAVRGDLERVPA
ncbi:carbohydrate kinase family protein [Frigoribacterium sp. VKM Ac-2836]|uniref:carbohydrate kinase family protein n=1 Tax=Frigoribacterium sp. VKM Ac-2836 TaxID=2739014 RepID=UPI00156493B6|nr:carbohydrate kinase family protein [Frigoribacterium sp. VKM Ac-2836]NRD25123.1 carbohydrate kinase family protein [Frigoribacterium sp. VKM Ac-2836]